MQPLPAVTPRAAPAALLSEKRIDRITIRIGDTLKHDLAARAHRQGISTSNYLVHLAALDGSDQAPDGRTLSDDLQELGRAINLVLMDPDQMTGAQRFWLIRRTARVTMTLAGGCQ